MLVVGAVGESGKRTSRRRGSGTFELRARETRLFALARPSALLPPSCAGTALALEDSSKLTNSTSLWPPFTRSKWLVNVCADRISPFSAH